MELKLPYTSQLTLPLVFLYYLGRRIFGRGKGRGKGSQKGGQGHWAATSCACTRRDCAAGRDGLDAER